MNADMADGTRIGSERNPTYFVNSDMNFKPIQICSTVVAFLVFGSTCQGNNNLFLPGDAFFPTKLTKVDIEALQKKKPEERTFNYSSFGGYPGTFSGWAGYDNATIPAVDDAFATNLATVYNRVREYNNRELVEQVRGEKIELIETNGIGVLFYPPEFKFPGDVLGLQYNENWVAETVKFGHKAAHVRLCCLIDDRAAVERSWRDAAIIPALKAKLPNVLLKPVPVTTEPVIVQGPVKAIVIGPDSPKDLFRLGDVDFRQVYIVDSKGITELTFEEGAWRSGDADDD
jgi:hypothetical protein